MAGLTCRDEVLDAFEAMRKATGRTDFTPAEVLAHLRAGGSAYRDSTIRTHVTAHLPDSGMLVRVGPGRYRLPRHGDHPPEQVVAPDTTAGERLTEDEVKAAVGGWLEDTGWTVTVAWGHERGIDLDAYRGTERLIIEAKGEAARGPQQANYFLNALGEIVQRMGDPAARYGLALPGHPQYRRLVDRLPALARERLLLDVFFVSRVKGQLVVEVDARRDVTPSQVADPARPDSSLGSGG